MYVEAGSCAEKVLTKNANQTPNLLRSSGGEERNMFIHAAVQGYYNLPERERARGPRDHLLYAGREEEVGGCDE